MEDGIITITYKDGTAVNFPKGVTCLEVSKRVSSQFKYDIIIAKLGNKLCELSKKINISCSIEFYDLTSKLGNRIYIKGLEMLLLKATKDVLGASSDIHIEHSIDKGIYFTILTPAVLNKKVIVNIENKMQELVKLNIPIIPLNISKEEMLEYYRKKQYQDKVDILKYETAQTVHLYKMGDTYDYYYDRMPHETSVLKHFALTHLPPNGVVLRFPTTFSPDKIKEYEHPELVFNSYKEYNDWSSRIGIKSVVDLNKKISTADIWELIQISEIHQIRELHHILDQILEKKEKIKLILIAGPSSSGKTSVSKKMALYLKSRGANPHPLSLDNYFKNREDTPIGENGKKDFESIEAIDLDLFKEQMHKLFTGEEVELPEFNFITGNKEYKNNCLKLDKDDILIVEGLHGLSEQLIDDMDKEKTFKVYVSPLAQMNIDNHTRINSSDIRILRRIIRDNRTRNYSSTDTIGRYEEVRNGEEKYIFPNQDKADVVFNTALPYELAIFKCYAEPLLFSVEPDKEEYLEARRLINLLEKFLPISSDDIPSESILREFIGKGIFKI